MYTPSYRKSKTNVPILRNGDLDNIGERVVGDFCPQALKTPMEVDIDRFLTRYCRMKQDFQFLSHCGMYLGMTVFHDTNKVVVYNPQQNRAEYISVQAGTVIIDNNLLAEKQEHRYRFTVGHEAAHGLLHSDYFANGSAQFTSFGSDYVPMVRCRMDNSHNGKNTASCWTDSDWMEWQANRLSSAILMPKSMVIAVAHQTEHKSNTILAMRDAVVSTFNVSREAALYRLQDLGLVP